MKAVSFRTVSENTWLFPTDTVGTPKQDITLHAARGGNVLFQLISDETVEEETPFDPMDKNQVDLSDHPDA